jgi:hypothetical protein
MTYRGSTPPDVISCPCSIAEFTHRAASMPNLNPFAKGVPRACPPRLVVRRRLPSGQHAQPELLCQGSTQKPSPRESKCRERSKTAAKSRHESCSATPTEIDAADHSLGCETLDNEGKRAQRVVLYVYRSQSPAGITGSTRPRRGASSRSAECKWRPICCRRLASILALSCT